MAGRIKALIDDVIRLRTKGNSSLEHFVRATLLMKGIDPDGFNEQSADDPQVIQALEKMLTDFSKPK